MADEARRENMREAIVAFPWDDYGFEPPPFMVDGEETDLLVNFADAMIAHADGDA